MDFHAELLTLLKEQGVVVDQLEVPPEPHMGDYALPCFGIAKDVPPGKLAQELAGKVTAPFLERVEAKGPYVNFFINPAQRAVAVLKGAASYGSGKKQKDTIMIEYSQPNTHKAFHVGHLRGTSLGESLARILKHAGYNVVQANYSGDTGAHIAKWLWYYTKHNPGEPPEDPHELEQWIAKIYVQAVQALAEAPEHEEEVNAVLRKLESGEDKELQNIYKKTRQQSIDAFTSIYNDLHAHFDEWYFEGEVEQPGKEISNELVKKGVAKVDDGATIVDLEDENLGVWVLLRKDGTALYSAKDLALAERKFKDHKITRSVYVIGHAQSMHMQQLFATLKRMQFPHVENCYHLSFAEVRLPEGKMSSRTGQNILYSDIRKEIATYATEEVRKRHDDWDEQQIQSVVDNVVVAALKWDMLAIHPNKNITFDPKKATEFEGETGPYVQYTHARACSILKKAPKKRGDGKQLLHEKEQAVLRLIEQFPSVLQRAAEEYHPALVANYTMQLAKAFNSFYHDCPVIGSDEEADRLALVDAVVKILEQALTLLAIDAPKEM